MSTGTPIIEQDYGKGTAIFYPDNPCFFGINPFDTPIVRWEYPYTIISQEWVTSEKTVVEEIEELEEKLKNLKQRVRRELQW